VASSRILEWTVLTIQSEKWNVLIVIAAEAESSQFQQDFQNASAFSYQSH
jgi:hypothetical protein